MFFSSRTGHKASSVSWGFWTAAAPAYFQVQGEYNDLLFYILCFFFFLTDNVNNFLKLKCRLLGTPNEQMWPGVSSLVNWHEYPQWSPQNLSSAVPNLDSNGLDLLAVSWTCSFIFDLHFMLLLFDSSIWFNSIIFLLFFITLIVEQKCLQQMLQYDPSKRISAKKAMDHPYFDDLNKTYL